MSEITQIPESDLTPVGQTPIEDPPVSEQSGAERTLDKVTGFAREHPALAVASGLAVGVLAAALLRGRLRSTSIGRGAGASLAKRALALAAAAGEIGLNLSREARESASHAAEEGRKRIGHEATVSKVPSKISPTNSPRPLRNGEPELPPVMSSVVRKSTGTSPSSGAT